MTSNETAFVQSVMKLIPTGSLLQFEYTPASGIRPEVAAACKTLGMDPRTYFVEFTGTSITGRGELLIHGNVINRGNEHRSFSPARLSKIEVLRHGPKA